MKKIQQEGPIKINGSVIHIYSGGGGGGAIVQVTGHCFTNTESILNIHKS